MYFSTFHTFTRKGKSGYYILYFESVYRSSFTVGNLYFIIFPKPVGRILLQLGTVASKLRKGSSNVAGSNISCGNYNDHICIRFSEWSRFLIIYFLIIHFNYDTKKHNYLPSFNLTNKYRDYGLILMLICQRRCGYISSIFIPPLHVHAFLGHGFIKLVVAAIDTTVLL